MTIENNSDELRHKTDEAKAADKAAASVPQDTGEPAESSPVPETPVDKDELRPEQSDNSYYAEASLTKKLIVFAVSTLAVLIALGLIFAYWPLGGRQ